MVLWNLASAAFSTSFSIATGNLDPQGFWIQNSGSIMYTCGGNPTEFEEWRMSTPWDLSTATEKGNKNSWDGTPNAIFFRDTGTDFFTVEIGDNKVYHYLMSTAWSLATATIGPFGLSVANLGTTGRAHDLYVQDSGAVMYVLHEGAKTISDYKMSTPWSLSTATQSKFSYAFTTQDTSPQGIYFAPSGALLYMIGTTNERIYKYALGTPWSLSTITFTGQSFAIVAANETTPRGISFQESGARIYTVGDAAQRIFQYNITADPEPGPPSTGSNVFINIGDAWKNGTMFINVGDAWKNADPFINIGDAWKNI